MTHLPFDAARAVKFDFDRGLVSPSAAEPHCLVSAAALCRLLQRAEPTAASELGEQLGAEAARRVSGRLGMKPTAPMATITDHVGGELAMLGLGAMSFERWGSALVVKITECPLGSVGTPVLVGLFRTLIEVVWSRATSVVVLEDNESPVVLRLLLTNVKTASQVDMWKTERVSIGDILIRLNRGTGA